MDGIDARWISGHSVPQRQCFRAADGQAVGKGCLGWLGWTNQQQPKKSMEIWGWIALVFRCGEFKNHLFDFVVVFLTATQAFLVSVKQWAGVMPVSLLPEINLSDWAQSHNVHLPISAIVLLCSCNLFRPFFLSILRFVLYVEFSCFHFTILNDCFGFRYFECEGRCHLSDSK